MSQFATFLFVLPFALIAWLFRTIRDAIRQAELNAEVYEWRGLALRRGDRVATSTQLDYPHIDPEDSGHSRPILVTSGKTGTVRSGRGAGSGQVNVEFDAQSWTQVGGGDVPLASFVDGIHIEYLKKL